MYAEISLKIALLIIGTKIYIYLYLKLVCVSVLRSQYCFSEIINFHALDWAQPPRLSDCSAGLALSGCPGSFVPGLWQQGKRATCCVDRGTVRVRLVELNGTLTASLLFPLGDSEPCYTTRTGPDHLGSGKHIFCFNVTCSFLCRAGYQTLVLFR